MSKCCNSSCFDLCKSDFDIFKNFADVKPHKDATVVKIGGDVIEVTSTDEDSKKSTPGFRIKMCTIPKQKYCIQGTGRLIEGAGAFIYVETCENSCRLVPRNNLFPLNEKVEFSECFVAKSKETWVGILFFGPKVTNILQITRFKVEKAKDCCLLQVIRDKVCDLQKAEKYDKVILQSDIDNGGDLGFQITKPGVYCLGEDVVFRNIGIQILSSCVTLDLQDHTMSSTPLNGLPTMVNSDPYLRVNGILVRGTNLVKLDNITIKNGQIKDIPKDPANNGDVGGGVRLLYAVAPFHICNVKVTRIGGDAGFVLENTEGILIENCQAVETTSQGFKINTSIGTLIKDCQTINTIGHGFITQSSCKDIQLIGCISSQEQAQLSVNASGFFVDGISITLIDCHSNESAPSGFVVAGSKHKLINCNSNDSIVEGFQLQCIECLFENCAANGSTTHGFQVFGDKNTICNSFSIGNTLNGFNFTATSNNNLVQSCKAVANVKIGFSNAGTNNNFVNNVATENSSNYFNISSAVFGALTNYWQNAANI